MGLLFKVVIPRMQRSAEKLYHIIIKMKEYRVMVETPFFFDMPVEETTRALTWILRKELRITGM
jgi:hypothetical protein